MKLDDWLTRLVAVPPGRSPLANGLAIGMRIALSSLSGIIVAIAIVLLHRNHASCRASPTSERNASTVQSDNASGQRTTAVFGV
jgi:hypothetical protein